MYDAVDGYSGYDSSVLNEIKSQQSALIQTLAQFQLNFKDEIARMEHILSGLMIHEEEVIRTHPQVVNLTGQSFLMMKIRTWMSKVIAQSNYTDAEIRAWCRVYWRELVDAAVQHGEDWELRPESYSSFVHDCIFTLQAMMNAAKNGGLREVVGKISKVVETSVMNTPQEKKKTIL